MKLFQKIKYFIQRGKKGYCDHDIYDMRSWFINIMPKMLDEFINSCDSYPVQSSSEKEWEEQLRYMRFCFEEANEETCSQKNPYDIIDKIVLIKNDDNTITFERNEMLDKWVEKDEELEQYRKSMLKEALRVLADTIYDMWN